MSIAFLEAKVNVASLPVKAPAAKKKHSRAAHLSALKRWRRAAVSHRREERTKVAASPHEGLAVKP